MHVSRKQDQRNGKFDTTFTKFLDSWVCNFRLWPFGGECDDWAEEGGLFDRSTDACAALCVSPHEANSDSILSAEHQ